MEKWKWPTVCVKYCLRNRVWNFKTIVTTSRGVQTRNLAVTKNVSRFMSITQGH